MDAATERTTERLLLALKTGGPQAAGDLAAPLGITAVAVRQHLDRLTQAGLVTHEDRREKVGRPRRHWRLTAEGHGRFPDNHAALTVELLDGIISLFGQDGLDRLIAKREQASEQLYRQALAPLPDLAAKVAELARLRAAEGYMACWQPADDDGFLLIEDHCPICAAATACRGLCRSELALFRGLLADLAEVERIDHLLNGARRCAYQIRPRTV